MRERDPADVARAPVDALRPAARFDLSLQPKLGIVLVSVAVDISADLHDVAFIRDS